MSDAPLLEMTGICKRFGATVALDHVQLRVGRGEVLALIGENGAGKSTLLKVLSGAHPADQGEIRIAGQLYRPQGPNDARRHGVAMIYQELNLAPDLSVEDNILLGMPGTGAGRMRTVLAPCSTHHSSSSIAFSTMGSVITGVVKMRFLIVPTGFV